MKYPIQKIQQYRLRRQKERKHRKQSPRIVVPSFFTLMNLFSGFLSIIMVAEGKLEIGAWLIVVAGLFDALDGFMARLANATSEFGIELDSISDIVSFGVAPGFLLYSFVLNELSIIVIILSALPPLCGAIRLARFNVDSKYATFDFYKGLPIPVQAAMVSALYLTFNKRMEWFSGFEHGFLSFIIPIVILLSFLMVSTIPFDKIPRFDKDSIKKYKNRMILFFVYILVIAIFQDIGLMIVFTFFIAKGLLLGSVVFWKRAFTDEEDPLEVPI